MNTKTYKILRTFHRSDRTIVVKKGLSLEEAQAHYSDPETSSRTCKLPKNTKRTRDRGPWSDHYTEMH